MSQLSREMRYITGAPEVEDLLDDLGADGLRMVARDRALRH